MTKPETQKLLEHGERMARIEQKQEDMDKKLDKIDSKIDGQNEIISSLAKTVDTKLERFFEKADNRYASKEYEAILKYAIGIILVAFMGLLIYAVGWK